MGKFAVFEATRFDRDGFLLIALVIDRDTCHTVADKFLHYHGAGTRHLIDHPVIGVLPQQPTLAALLGNALGANAFMYLATLFDKDRDANWLVAWHQNWSNPVALKVEVVGYSGSSCKDGVWDVQAPTSILASLVALWINLDDCDEDNGPLRVLAGSHHFWAGSTKRSFRRWLKVTSKRTLPARAATAC